MISERFHTAWAHSGCARRRPLAVSHQRHSGRLRLEPDAALVHDVRHGHACRDLTGISLDRTVRSQLRRWMGYRLPGTERL